MIKTRNGKILNSNESQNKLLEKLYGSAAGRILLKVLTAPILSKAAGKFLDSPLSKDLIKPFIKSAKIDTSQYILTDIKCFNDFFARKIKPDARKFDMNPDSLISPCDSKLTAYKINSWSVFRIKGSYYRVADLLASYSLAEKYKNGLCLIFRLEVDDYHRYCYIDNGTKSDNTFIKGVLHTVNPIALERYNIYKRNSREYTTLHTENFGDVMQIEVGAMLVGKISNNHGEAEFKRGDEKGKFLYGGSTIVLLIEDGKAVIDRDIVKNSAEGFETKVLCGEKIGRKSVISYKK